MNMNYALMAQRRQDNPSMTEFRRGGPKTIRSEYEELASMQGKMAVQHKKELKKGADAKSNKSFNSLYMLAEQEVDDKVFFLSQARKINKNYEIRPPRKRKKNGQKSFAHASHLGGKERVSKGFNISFLKSNETSLNDLKT